MMIIKKLMGAFLAMALSACLPAVAMAANEDISAAIALVNEEMAEIYPGNTYRFDEARLAYGYRVIITGIAHLTEQGYTIDGVVETSGRPDALYAQASTKLQHVSIDLGQYYGINRGILNTFPGQVYLELLEHPPSTSGGSSGSSCPDVSADLAKIRAAADAIEAKVR